MQFAARVSVHTPQRRLCFRLVVSFSFLRLSLMSFRISRSSLSLSVLPSLVSRIFERGSARRYPDLVRMYCFRGDAEFSSSDRGNLRVFFLTSLVLIIKSLLPAKSALLCRAVYQIGL